MFRFSCNPKHKSLLAAYLARNIKAICGHNQVFLWLVDVTELIKHFYLFYLDDFTVAPGTNNMKIEDIALRKCGNGELLFLLFVVYCGRHF